MSSLPICYLVFDHTLGIKLSSLCLQPTSCYHLLVNLRKSTSIKVCNNGKYGHNYNT